MKKTTLLLMVCLAIFACTSTDSEGETTDETLTNQEETVAVSSNPPEIEEKKKPLSSADLLQGKWESNEDAKSRIVFEGNMKKEIYDGEELASEEFTLSDKCENEDMGLELEKDRYITSDDICHYILKITETDLELSYVARGNTSTYKRVE